MKFNDELHLAASHMRKSGNPMLYTLADWLDYTAVSLTPYTSNSYALTVARQYLRDNGVDHVG